jgi:hypothetical protein
MLIFVNLSKTGRDKNLLFYFSLFEIKNKSFEL